MGLRDEIIATAKRPREIKKVEGEPWGMDGVYVLKMSGTERDLYQQEVISRCDKNGTMTNVVGWRSKVVTMFACDEYGVKIFEPKDATVINDTDPDALDLVFDAVLEFNGVTTEAQEALEKNSDGEVGSGSLPASHSTSESRPLGSFLDGSPVMT